MKQYYRNDKNVNYCICGPSPTRLSGFWASITGSWSILPVGCEWSVDQEQKDKRGLQKEGNERQPETSRTKQEYTSVSWQIPGKLEATADRDRREPKIFLKFFLAGLGSEIPNKVPVNKSPESDVC